MKRETAVLWVLLLAGCEGDEKKAARLQQELGSSHLLVWYCDQPTASCTPADRSERAANYAVAQRNYNKFMAGR